MLRPLILALCLGLLPIGMEGQARAGEGASFTDLSENAYRRDVARGADLSVEKTALELKHNAGRISDARYKAGVARCERQIDSLARKWEQVNPRASVMFTGDVLQRAWPREAELREKYAPKPKPKPAPPAPAFDPYLAAQPQEPPNQMAGEKLFSNIGWIFLASFIFCASVGLLSVLWSRWFPKAEEEEPEPETSGVYGTASFHKFVATLANKGYVQTGVFLGKSSHPQLDQIPVIEQPGAPLCSIPKNHTLIVARTRTGKGTRVIVPTLLRYVHSVVVIDPKGENAAITARARQNLLQNGEKVPVYIVNPWGVMDQHFRDLGFTPATYNPLSFIDRSHPSAVSIAQALANTICPKTGGKDDYWQGRAADVIAAVILWITDQPGERNTLGRLREITSLPRKKLTEQFMIPMSASSAFGGAISELISPFIDLADETYSGVMSNVAEGLKFMSDPMLKEATSRTSFNIMDLIQDITTVYLIIPPELIATQRTWLRLMIAGITQVYRAVPLKDHLGNSRLQRRLMMLIDEFPALGRMPDIPTDLATMAGYGIDYTLVVQGIDQLKTSYKDEWNTIVSNCAFKWFCNVSDNDTAKYVSEGLGKATVQTIGKSESTGFNPGGESSGASTTYGETGRPLFTPDELTSLGRDAAIVFYPESRPHYVRPIDYWNLQGAFARFEATEPQTYWRPRLEFDENPYHDGT